MVSYIGPIVNPKTRIGAAKEASSIFVDWKFFMATGTPGANIDDAKGLE
jgi:hypothetical protein